MSKRSAAVAELESHLREMIGPSGGLSETRWVGRLVELMRETANTEGREYLLKVVLATPDRPTLTRFIQLGGVELLGQWINEHRKQTGQEDRQVLHTMLSCLNKLNISRETMQRTEIGKVVNSLSKHTDSSISAKAASIVAKWKKQIAEPAEESKSARQMTKAKETRVTVVPVPAKRPVDEPIRFLPMDPPPPSVELYQPVRRVRYALILKRISLSNVDGWRTSTSPLPSSSTATTNPTRAVPQNALQRSSNRRPNSLVSTTFAREKT